MTTLHRISPKDKANTSCDVIFVHGLGGHHHDTWTAKKDTFWPAWLDEALPAATVFTAEYDASPSAWLGDTMPLTDRAGNLLELFNVEGIGRRPIIFATHSLGGLVVKQLLRHSDSYGTLQWKSISEQTRGVVFLATPHSGSDATKYLEALKHISRPTVLIGELRANAAALRDLNIWYRNNVQRLRINNQIFFETNDTHGIRIVDENTADPGIAGIVPIPVDGDHLTICKPADSDSLVFKSVKKFISDIILASSDQSRPRGNANGVTPRFNEVSSLTALVETLDDPFDFRWEKSSFDTSHGKPLIYWPVRLRHPTPIHAAQCFAGSGLQQRGAEVHLFVDDLGEQNFSVEAFVGTLRGWFGMTGGNSSDLRVTTFTSVIPPTENGGRNTARPWPTVRKWLGDTEYRMEFVLRLAKLAPLSGPLSLDRLGEKRPRRLLTPALVWSCLDYLHTTNPNRPVITLGGYDERPLWAAWREQGISPSAQVGHLYAPQLDKIDNQHGSVALHMASHTQYSIEWESRDDIRKALDSEFEAGTDWHKPNRLIPWCAKSCIFLPRFFSGQELGLQVGDTILKATTSLEGLTPTTLRPVLVDELARWVI